MLQFNKSEATNTNAVWVQTVNTSSGYYDNLIAVVSQSYDNSSETIELTTVSSPNQYRNWLVIRNIASEVPSASGQYDVEIYTSTTGSEERWGFTTEVWGTTTEQWATFGGSGLPNELVYSDRAFVSGSNEDTITQYLSPNENGTYTTYNG